MSHVRILWVIFVVGPFLAAPAQQSSKIVSAGLFKNGLASVTREYTVPGPGSYTFDALGSPVHGTLWIESEGPVVARSGVEAVEGTEEESASAGLGEALVGKEVEIGLRLESATPFTGRLLAAPGGADREIPIHLSRWAAPVAAPPTPAGPAMYVIEEGGTRSYLAPDLVAYVRALEPGGPVKREKAILVLEVGEGAPSPTVIRVRYLARGLSWAPSYRLDLSDRETLAIGQSAVVRHELENLEGVALELISGFPNVEFLQATSPFATGVSWDAFLAQLAQRPTEFNGVATQQVLSNSYAPEFSPGALVPPPVMPGEGTDLHYQAIGQQSIPRGGALALTTAEARAPYERVVEWTVNRNRPTNTPMATLQEDMWDAVRFRNPFDFPMTTAPAMVEADGRFLGSKTTRWASPGEETLAYVGKALSVRGDYREEEVSRKEIIVLDRPAIQSTVRGTLTVRNPRAEAVNLIIQDELNGTLRRADGDPISAVGTAGPGRRNPSARLTWNLTLAAGEERALTLEYIYLVD